MPDKLHVGEGTAWRRTFTDLRDRFQEASERFPSVRYVVLQALDTPGAIPKRFQRMFQKAGGYDVGEIKPLFEPHPNGLPPGLDPDFAELVTKRLRWDCPAKLGYLSGPRTGRSRFATLAQQAWLAMPGTPVGKAGANSQSTATERWWKVIQEELLRNSGSYFTAYRLLLAEYRDPAGLQREEVFEAEQVEKGDYVGVGYPKVENLPAGAQRWLVTDLATDAFTASAVAIDMLLADPNSEGSRIVSWEEMNDHIESPGHQNANHFIGRILLSNNGVFSIYRYDCTPVVGNKFTVCPNADLPDEQSRQNLIRLLPEIEHMYRKRGFIKPGESIHWVGRKTTLGALCRCFPTRREAIGEGTQRRAVPAVPTRGARAVLPDRFCYGTVEIDELSKSQWRLLDALCENGSLLEAVDVRKVISHIYGIPQTNHDRILAKDRALQELRRRTQKKLNRASIPLLIDRTNETLRLQPVQ